MIEMVGRAWRHNPGTQMATLGVLTATFALVLFMLTFSTNFKRVLTVWGEKVQIAVYLEDGLPITTIEKIKKEIQSMASVAEVEFVSKEVAADLFREQMASYAPDLMADPEFATPFPASLNVRLKEESAAEISLSRIEQLARRLQKREGVEDVSFGQSWIRNYASFLDVIQTAGMAIGGVLLLASLLIVGNSIRTLVAGRREEIEILELIGATRSFIRRPYILEGALLGAIASGLAVAANGAIFSWQLNVMKKSLAFARISNEFRYFQFWEILLIILVASLIGALGAWFTVRSLNDGWAAAKKLEAKGELV
jgi:cell division transport system permease protein